MKAPFSWPNSSALDQLARDRRHVDGDERPVAPLAVVVQRARDQLLAGAGFARDHHREIGLHQPRQQPVDFLHRRRAADQRNRSSSVGLGRRRALRSVGSDSARPTIAISSFRSNGFGRYS